MTIYNFYAQPVIFSDLCERRASFIMREIYIFVLVGLVEPGFLCQAARTTWLDRSGLQTSN